MRRGAGSLDDGDGLARSSPRGHHIVNDQHPSFDRRTDQSSAFAMVLGLLAVVCEGPVVAEAGQLDGDGSRQRNALVGGPEDHVEFDATGNQPLCIELGQPAQLGAIVKQAGIEEIGAQAPGLGLEFAKAQDARIHRELHKFLGQLILTCIARHRRFPCSN